MYAAAKKGVRYGYGVEEIRLGSFGVASQLGLADSRSGDRMWWEKQNAATGWRGGAAELPRYKDLKEQG